MKNKVGMTIRVEADRKSMYKEKAARNGVSLSLVGRQLLDAWCDGRIKLGATTLVSSDDGEVSIVSY